MMMLFHQLAVQAQNTPVSIKPAPYQTITINEVTPFNPITAATSVGFHTRITPFFSPVVEQQPLDILERHSFTEVSLPNTAPDKNQFHYALTDASAVTTIDPLVDFSVRKVGRQVLADSSVEEFAPIYREVAVSEPMPPADRLEDNAKKSTPPAIAPMRESKPTAELDTKVVESAMSDTARARHSSRITPAALPADFTVRQSKRQAAADSSVEEFTPIYREVMVSEPMPPADKPENNAKKSAPTAPPHKSKFTVEPNTKAIEFTTPDIVQARHLSRIMPAAPPADFTVPQPRRQAVTDSSAEEFSPIYREVAASGPMPSADKPADNAKKSAPTALPHKSKPTAEWGTKAIGSTTPGIVQARHLSRIMPATPPADFTVRQSRRQALADSPVEEFAPIYREVVVPEPMPPADNAKKPAPTAPPHKSKPTTEPDTKAVESTTPDIVHARRLSRIMPAAPLADFTVRQPRRQALADFSGEEFAPIYREVAASEPMPPADKPENNAKRFTSTAIASLSESKPTVEPDTKAVESTTPDIVRVRRPSRITPAAPLADFTVRQPKWQALADSSAEEFAPIYREVVASKPRPIVSAKNNTEKFTTTSTQIRKESQATRNSPIAEKTETARQNSTRLAQRSDIKPITEKLAQRVHEVTTDVSKYKKYRYEDNRSNLFDSFSPQQVTKISLGPSLLQKQGYLEKYQFDQKNKKNEMPQNMRLHLTIGRIKIRAKPAKLTTLQKRSNPSRASSTRVPSLMEYLIKHSESF